MPLRWLAVFVGTAMANEWNLYGNARMATFYTSDKLEDRQFWIDADRSSIKDTQWNCRVTPVSARPSRAT